jgi:hypothetical protein
VKNVEIVIFTTSEHGWRLEVPTGQAFADGASAHCKSRLVLNQLTHQSTNFGITSVVLAIQSHLLLPPLSKKKLWFSRVLLAENAPALLNSWCQPM